MARELTARQIAEGVEEVGDGLIKLIGDFDRLCNAMGPDLIARVDAIPHQEWIDGVARAIRDLGERLCVECDQAEGAEDRRRDNPLEPDFRRLGQ